MADRRKGTTRFWEAFWLLILGERRNGIKDRRSEVRQSLAERIVYDGCSGMCHQGRKPCNCPMKDKP